MRTELEASEVSVAAAAAAAAAVAAAEATLMVMWMQPMAHSRNVCGLYIVAVLRLLCDYPATSSNIRRSINSVYVCCTMGNS